MPKESNLEFKVGLFVLFALTGLTAFIFSISDSSVFSKHKSLKIIFSFADGLKLNAPVRIAGVDQGIVKDINLFFDRQDARTKAEVDVWVNKDVKIPSDSMVIINQLGLLGEKYIEITPGIDTKSFLEDGQTIIGKDPVPQAVISEKIMNVATKLDTTIAGVSRILNDERNVKSFGDTLENVSFMTGSFKAILGDIQQGKGTLGRLVYDEGLYNDLHGLTSDLKANPWKLLYRPKDNK